MNIFDIFGQSDERERVEEPKRQGLSTIQKIAMLGLPILFSALKKNNADEKKAEALRDTLSRHEVEHQGSIFDRITAADERDGDKIMDHILADKKMDAIEKIAKETGTSVEEVYSILKKLSPAVLEQLAHDTKGSRTVEDVRRSTDRQLQRYQEHENTFDLKDLAGKIFGGSNQGGGLLDGIGDVISNLFK